MILSLEQKVVLKSISVLAVQGRDKSTVICPVMDAEELTTIDSYNYIA